jgi:hypothetical protein
VSSWSDGAEGRAAKDVLLDFGPLSEAQEVRQVGLAAGELAHGERTVRPGQETDEVPTQAVRVEPLVGSNLDVFRHRLITHDAGGYPPGSVRSLLVSRKRMIVPSGVQAIDAYKLLIGLVVPRPIGWIESTDADGVRHQDAGHVRHGAAT